MLGDGITLARTRKDISQDELAKLVGTTQSYISKIETGFNNPSLDMVDKIAEALEIPTPLIMWFGVKREDIAKDKQHLFDILKPSIDEMLLKLFSNEKIN